jgi:iron complex transport system ATP-binding protein
LPRRSEAKAGQKLKTQNLKLKPPILSVSQLRLRRGTTHILQDISWQVLTGQHWAILGANGSGKTSLLSALTGYLTPTAGTISVLGHQYGRTDWRELRKQIGLVSSSLRQLIPNDEPACETVVSGKLAMIGFWGKPQPSDRRRAMSLLRQVDCEHVRDRRWEVLSQGERQRVLIARALMPNPRLLILDEPCAGLDPSAREHFLQFLDRLGRRKTAPALVFVTHHVEEIMPVFSHVLFLKAGRVLAEGIKERVLTSKLLSQAFDTSITLSKSAARYSLNIPPNPIQIV